MKPNHSLRTQVTIGLSYNHSPQEKAYILQVLTKRFGVRKIEKVPFDDPHERILRFTTRSTLAHSQSFLDFLEHQKRTGVLFEYELCASEEKKGPCASLFALICRAMSWKIARWSTRVFHIKERNRAMGLRVTTLADLTQAQREALQRLGCGATPYISWPHALVFAATCESWQEQELRHLAYVTRVEPMPTYQLTYENDERETMKRSQDHANASDSHEFGDEEKAKMREKGPHIRVEYDLRWTGGIYSNSGLHSDYVYVPCALIEQLGSVEQALTEMSEGVPLKIIGYSQELYQQNGEPWDEAFHCAQCHNSPMEGRCSVCRRVIGAAHTHISEGKRFCPEHKPNPSCRASE